MALTKDIKIPQQAGGTARHRTGKLAANAIAFLGGIAAKNAAGYLVAASDAAGLTVVGIFESAGDNTGGADGAVEVSYVTGVAVQVDNAGGAIVQASLFGPCYVASDAGVTTAAVAANDVLVGLVSEFTAAKVWVYVDELMKAAPLAVPVDGSEVAVLGYAAVNPATYTPGVPVIIPIDHADHATETLIYKTGVKIQIIDSWLIKDQADAGGTVQLTDAADAAITNAMVAAVDKTVTHAGTIDKAKRTVNAGGTFKAVFTRGAGNSASQLFVLAIPMA